MQLLSGLLQGAQVGVRREEVEQRQQFFFHRHHLQFWETAANLHRRRGRRGRTSGRGPLKVGRQRGAQGSPPEPSPQGLPQPRQCHPQPQGVHEDCDEGAPLCGVCRCLSQGPTPR